MSVNPTDADVEAVANIMLAESARRRIRHAITTARSNPDITTAQLAQRVGVSWAQAHRYVCALRRAGVLPPATERVRAHVANAFRPNPRLVAAVKFEARTFPPNTPREARIVLDRFVPAHRPAPRPRIREITVCVCGAADVHHPTPTCRDFFERGL